MHLLTIAIKCIALYNVKIVLSNAFTNGILTYNNLHQKMPTLDTQNAHAGGTVPTQEVRHSRQKQHQKPSAWACHQSEVDLVMSLACSAKFLR